MPSDWNIFVSKIYKEEHDKDSSYQFKDAMIDASKRKSEMGLPAKPVKPATAKPESVAVESEMQMPVKKYSRKSMRKKSRGKKSRGKKSHHKKSRKMHKKSRKAH